MTYRDHRKAMLADILMELIEDPDLEASEVSDAVMDELEDIHAFHSGLAEKTARIIKYLGG